MSGIMGVRHVLGTGTYLGLPSMVGRSKKATFGFIKDRIWKKINSWRGRALSKAGKDVMIKSVLQAIPSYIMSVYLIPGSIISDIERMLNSFWWGDGSNHKGIRWLAWDRLARPKAVGGLGYRDFHAFNMSLIAKQAWKFMAEPNKLVSRIFKARYFPHSSIFYAKLGNNPSYVWRSVWKSRDVLSIGCRWKIGDGSKINVMSDPWFRGNDSLWMQAPQLQSTYDLFVHDLLVQDMKAWDSNKIHSLFSEHVAESILKIPLFEEVQEDRLVWNFENHGSYTVKSGYNNYIKWKAVDDSLRMEGEWNSIWNITAPPKTKHLLWRICRGCLPTRVRLRERHVPCPNACPFCDSHEEDERHILFNCMESNQVWIEAGLRNVIDHRLLLFNDVRSLVFDICKSEPASTVGHFAMVTWCIWNHRNNWVWNGVRDTAKEVAMRAVHMFGEWSAINSLQQNTNNPVTSAVLRVPTLAGQVAYRESHGNQFHRWQKPRDGWWKCNVDASFSQNPHGMAYAWCLRDVNGEFIAAGTNSCNFHVTVTEGEALAILEAMRQCIERGWTNILFESDAKLVVEAVHSTKQGNSELSSIISSIKLLLQQHSNFEVKFTKRQANMAAHTLARAACSWPSRMFFTSIPRCIEPIIINEMS
jgi:ribonuclease HI